MDRSRLFPLLSCLGVMAVALCFRYYPHNYCAPECVLLRHDELHYLVRVLAFLNGSWDVRYFINPTLYAYLLYAAVLVNGGWAVLSGQFPSLAEYSLAVTFDPYPILVAGRLVTIAASVLSVGLVYALSRRLFSRWTALLASLALALNATHASRSALTGNECVTVFFCLLVFAGLLYYLRRPGAFRHALCGFLLGIAGSVKYNAFIFLIPFAVATFIAALREDASGDRPLWRRWMGGLGRCVRRPRYMIGFLFIAMGLVVGSPCILLNFHAFSREFFRQYSYLHEGFSDLDRAAHSVGYLYYLVKFPKSNDGLVLGILCGVGMISMIVTAVARRDARHVLVLSAALPLYLFLGVGRFNRMRFLLPALPFILLCGAWAFTGIMEFLTGLSRGRGVHGTGLIVRHAVVAAAGAAVLLPAAPEVRHVMEREFAHDRRREIMLWIKENLNAGDRTIEFTNSSFYQYPGSTRVLELFEYREAWFGSRYRKDMWRAFKNRRYPFTSLQSLLGGSKTMAELKERIRKGKYRYLLITLHAGYLRKIPYLPRYAPNQIAHCPYWNEFLEFLGGLPLRHRMTSPDGNVVMMLYALH